MFILVEGEAEVCSIEVHGNTRIEDVKRYIFCLGLSSLEGVAKDRCSLYMVDIDLSDYNHNVDALRYLNADSVGGVKLEECHTVLEYWPGGLGQEPLRPRLQILVRVEDSGPFTRGSKRQHVTETGDPELLVDVQEKQAKRYRSGAIPSEVCRDARSMETQQIAAEILNGRPWTSAGPPVALYHPVFDQFMQEPVPKYKTATDPFDSIKIDDAFLFMRLSSEFYVTEKSGPVYDSRLIGRVDLILPVLNRLLGVTTTLRTKDSESDGRVVVRTPSGDYGISTIVEVKLEPGIGGDGKTQVQQSYARACSLPEYNSVRRRSCCPCFLVAIEGPWITVMGAVFLEKVIVQHLAGPIFLPPQNLHGPQTIDTVLRLFYGLRNALGQLDKYYSSLPPEEISRHGRFFPHVRSYRDDISGTMKPLNYTTPLANMSSAVYLANVETDLEVVVKFALTYNVEAHCLLAKHDLAPKLLYDGTVPNAPRYGGLMMLVMEHVDGETLVKYLRSSPSQERLEAILKSVETAIHLLHEQDLVFGDLRTPNILVDKDDRVRLVDFDWCGRHRIDKYPFVIGDGVDWAVGVGPLSTMDKDHDLHMLKNLVARIRAGEVPGTW